ncbi:hypothetical protein SAMN04488117_109125 [Celeribacter baekdonensis]|uniref:Uncharacterized protein n=1 Tax=Celeribacter baekdonensis TaxID=875171 RepID=A0A1G7QGM0_9RHOB|nr:hypothetical protein [Celeribacter baekdonensis]SDF97661.1 hypothetical protein SAMN04488117_109125 [Celeribacter baekdonensis]
MNELLELSWRTQVVLIGGYLSYIIAYSGRRESHTTTDVLGIILCFGGIGLISIGSLERLFELCSVDWLRSDYVLGSLGVMMPTISAIVWRRTIAQKTKRLLSFLTQDKEDGLPSAWSTIIQKENLEYAQLVVTLKNGYSYESYPLGDFNNYPNGPCVFGSDGSVGMYITYITPLDQEGRQAESLIDADGIRITYIPKDQIAEIDFRRKARER